MLRCDLAVDRTENVVALMPEIGALLQEKFTCESMRETLLPVKLSLSK